MSAGIGRGVEAFLWGSHPEPRRQTRRVVTGFAALVLAGYGAFALSTRPPLDAVVGPAASEWLFAAVTFYAPPLAAAASTARRGGLVAALAVGAVPAVAFGLLATVAELLFGRTGDATVWGLAAVFAVFGVVGAVAGYAVVAVGRLAVGYWRA